MWTKKRKGALGLQSKVLYMVKSEIKQEFFLVAKTRNNAMMNEKDGCAYLKFRL